MSRTKHIFTAEPLECRDWSTVAALFRIAPHKPFSGWGKWSDLELSELADRRARSIFENERTTSWLVGDQNNPHAFGSLSVLDWDSEQLQRRAARIEYLVAAGNYHEQFERKDSLLKFILRTAAEKGLEHLSVRVDASDVSSLHALEGNGFQTVDGILTFGFDVANLNPTLPVGDFDIRIAGSDDAEAAAELARSAYAFDRFHADPEIADKYADNLHATWVRNSCLGFAADAVLVAEDNHGLLGYVTSRLQNDAKSILGGAIGVIVLVAVAKRARGRGVGKAITLASLKWFQDQNAPFVEVGTQFRNLPATRLYQNCGFRLVASSISLRSVL